MEKKTDGRFTYTYSAERQSELQRIREKYAPRTPDRMERLRRLDQAAERPGRAAAIAVGALGLLVFGLGLCCVLEWELYAPGVLVGVVGLAAMALALPVYARVTRRKREQIAPQVLQLIDEISHGEP